MLRTGMLRLMVSRFPESASGLHHYCDIGHAVTDQNDFAVDFELVEGWVHAGATSTALLRRCCGQGEEHENGWASAYSKRDWLFHISP